VAGEAGCCFGAKKTLTVINQQTRKKKDGRFPGKFVQNKPASGFNTVEITVGASIPPKEIENARAFSPGS
jgi:hypothetical protein